MPSNSSTHVAVIGAGAAGISAAIGLAKLGVRVTVIEGARKPGAENWSGAVYFCENLARPELLGEELLAQTPLERRVVQRGLLVCDGRNAAGFAVRSERAFRHVYTVLRPLFDQDLAAKATLFGAEILADTQALALLRSNGRVTGVLTDRGPITADLVFLAEGDASQLVSREGLERIAPGADGLARPAFLQGIKEVLALPAEDIEKRFGLGAMEGACFEILLRNGALGGHEVPLNAGAFLYTNRESLSLGLVMPLENLREFTAPHQQLMEWLKALPALQPLLRGTRTLGYGAKLIRGGGHKQRPHLVQDGLALGGAAGGFGVDFPAPNYTGPATYCGYALTLAVRDIIEGGADFAAANLQQGYVQRLQASRYWKDEVQLASWPEFVASTRSFFGFNAEALARGADALTRPAGSLHAAVAEACAAGGTAGLAGVGRSSLEATDALGARRGSVAAALRALPFMLRNTVSLRAAEQPDHDEKLVPLFWEAETQARGLPPLLARRQRRLQAGIAAALFALYRNDATTVEQKLQLARDAVLRRLTLWDCVRLPLALFNAVSAARKAAKSLRGPGPPDYLAVQATRSTDDMLALLQYSGEAATHIRFLAKRDASGRPADAASSLFHVCPARVYQAQQDLARNTSVTVLHENCIRCESCWRAEDAHVDWGRTRAQRVGFECSSSASAWLQESLEAAALSVAAGRPALKVDAPLNGPLTVVPKALRRIQRRCFGFLALMREAPSVLSGGQQAQLVDFALALASALENVAAPEVAVQVKLSSAARTEAERLAAALRLHAGAGRFFQAEADALLVQNHWLPQQGVDCEIIAASPRLASGAGLAALRSALAERFPRAALHAADDAAQLSVELRAALLDALKGHVSTYAPCTRNTLAALAGLSPALAWLGAETVLARELCALAGHSLPQDVLVAVPEGALRCEAEAVVGTALTLGACEQALLLSGEFMALATRPMDVATNIGALGMRAAQPVEVVWSVSNTVALLRCAGVEASAVARRDALVAVVAHGIAHVLCQRASEHALSRVQFPGLFRDLRGRDSIAKFGAVREMLGGLATGSETLLAFAEGALDVGGAPRNAAPLNAVLATEVLGPGPRSMAYLAGQVLGGTAYSEEDDVCRLFRDAAALARVSMDAHKRREQRVVRMLRDGFANALRSESQTASPQLDAAFASCALALDACQQRVIQTAQDVRVSLHSDVARLAGLVDAASALVARFDVEQERGNSGAAAHAALLSVLLRAERRANLLRERCADAGVLVELGRRTLASGLDAPAAAWKGGSYADWLAQDRAHQSGDLVAAAQSPLTPECAAADPALAERVVDKALWREHCGAAWQRGVEQAHQLSLSDLALLRTRGAFRMVVPEHEGGLGLSKLAYYRSCAQMARHGDISQPVVVMGSMSIGCLPLLIGLKDDLPKLHRALEAWLSSAQELNALAAQLEAGTGGMQAVERVAALMPQERTLRALLAPLEKAVKAARTGAPLQALSKALCSALQRARAELASIEPRGAAHKFFLGLIASGRISAFALTEPSAGSDTARVRTRAELVTVPVQRDPRGFSSFIPAGATTPRNLFERSALRCSTEGVFWLRPDGSEVEVQWVDRGFPGGPRREVVLDGVAVQVHDIGRVEQGGASEVYRYWQVNGAKMWITNASIAGVMILYARTAAGISAFSLDAHAEGLSVGRDEHKMGQRGSTTNELTLLDVRIPVDQLLGLEGRGQENALETLNVGRAGLAFVSLAEMQALFDELRPAIADLAHDAVVLREIGRMALDCLSTESVAYALTGCFDHKGMRSIRMDSAIAKTLATEALMRCLTRAEAMLPRNSVLESSLFEKRRRDARVLSIYEGTNEIQRFLLMRDALEGFDLQRMQQPAAGRSVALTQVLGALCSQIESARTVAAAITADAVLQPLGFALADGLLRVAGAASLEARAATLRASGCTDTAWQTLLDLAAQAAVADAGRRAAIATQSTRQAVAALCAGVEPHAVTQGDDMLLRSVEAEQRIVSVAQMQPQPAQRTLRIAVLLDPQPDLLARQWAHGRDLFSGHYALSSNDRYVLAQALAMKRAVGGSIAVFAAGSPLGIPVLREALALGADSALLMEERGAAILGSSMAEAFAEALTLAEDLAGQTFDVILSAESFAAAALPLAQRLGRSVLHRVTAVHANVVGGAVLFSVANVLGRSGASFQGPACLLLLGECAPQALRFSVEGWLGARDKSVVVVPAPRPGVHAELRAVETEVSQAAQAVGPLTLEAAARRCLELAEAPGSAASQSVITLQSARRAGLLDASALALVLCAEDGAPTMEAAAAIQAVRQCHARAVVVGLVQTRDAEVLTAAASALLGLGAQHVLLVPWPEWSTAGLMAQAAALRSLLAGVHAPVVAAEALSCAMLLQGPSGVDGAGGLIDRVDRLRVHADGSVQLSGLRYSGRARMSVQAPVADLRVITAARLSKSEEIALGHESVSAHVLSDVPWPTIADPLIAALARAQAFLGAPLSSAEFIIDVGYGVGSRDGLELVVEPLERALAEVGVRGVMVGATRKVTMDLGILPAHCQIGQTGVSVDPRVILALGVSGAPQHMGWIGERCVIFAFNKDPEAALMLWNSTHARPLVIPIPGDLFREVPRFIEALRKVLAEAVQH